MITACDGGCPYTLFHRLELNAKEHLRTLQDSTMQLCKGTRGLPHHTSLLEDNVRNPAARAKALSWERTWNAWGAISVRSCAQLALSICCRQKLWHLLLKCSPVLRL